MAKINLSNMFKFFNKSSSDPKNAELRSIDYKVNDKNIASPKEIYLKKLKIDPPTGYYKAGWLLIDYKWCDFLELRMYYRNSILDLIEANIIVLIDRKTLDCKVFCHDPLSCCSNTQIIKNINQAFIRYMNNS